MPRINIEDSELASLDFQKYAAAIGNYSEAIGAFVLALRMAQDFYKYDKKSVPFSRFKRLDHYEKLIRFELFHRGRNGVTYRHSAREFAWLLQIIDCSRKGGESLKKKMAGQGLAGGPPTPSPTHGNENSGDDLITARFNPKAAQRSLKKVEDIRRRSIEELDRKINSKDGPEL